MHVDSTTEETTTGTADDEAAKAAADKLAADKLAADKAAEEAAKAAEEAGRATEEETAKVPTEETSKAAEEEASRRTAEEGGEESGGCTDGTEATGAASATPATGTSAAAAASTPEEPPPSKYLKVGNGVYVSLPWAASSRAPTEGEAFDEEIIAAAGLQLVDEPSASSSTSEEERLLQKLLSLHRTRREKLASREALVAKAEADIQKRVEELQDFHTRILQAQATKRAQLAADREALLLLKSEFEQKQEEAAQRLSAREGQLAERKIILDVQEEDLVKREEALAETLRQKDEEVARRVTERTQGQEQEFKDKVAALAKDYACKLKEASDAAAAAEATRKDAEAKAAKLEADLRATGERLSTLESERKKVTHTLAEMQITVAKKNDLLSAANDSIEDLKLKLTTLEERLDDARKREELLAAALQKEKSLLQNAVATHGKFRENVGIFTDRLADAAANIDKELTTMGVQDFGYSTDKNMQTSVKLALFFDGVVEALQQLQDGYRAQLADESRRLCRGVLKRLLVKIAYRNPGVDFTNIFKKLPKEYDPSALEALVAPIVERVDKVQRVEGEHRN
jgi:hypothetical protein